MSAYACAMRANASHCRRLPCGWWLKRSALRLTEEWRLACQWRSGATSARPCQLVAVRWRPLLLCRAWLFRLRGAFNITSACRPPPCGSDLVMSRSSGFEMSQSRPTQVLGLGYGHGDTCGDDHDDDARNRPPQDGPGHGGSNGTRVFDAVAHKGRCRGTLNESGRLFIVTTRWSAHAL
jgi:hypothetical protein